MCAEKDNWRGSILARKILHVMHHADKAQRKAIPGYVDRLMRREKVENTRRNCGLDSGRER